MPGIIGCTTSTGTSSEVLAGRQTLKYADSYQEDNLYEDEFCCCSRTHINIIGEKTSPVILQNIYCWVEGEFYNIKEINNHFSILAKTEGALLLEAYQKGLLSSVLARIDGYFAALIYDKQAAKLHFISDRLGLKPIFIWQSSGKLAWSSEIKGLLTFRQFHKKINREGFHCFYQNGHFLGDTTWFEEVKQLSAATLLIYSVKDKKIIQNHRYWSWNKIKPADHAKPEILDHLEALLKKAVARRTSLGDQPLTLGLSGGLDSRAILASLPPGLSVHAYTFGKKACQDIKYARKAAKLANAQHHSFELHAANWLNGRVESIWKSDAAISFLHFHFGQFHDQVAQLGKIMLNGFIGDLVMGGSWLRNFDERISAKTANQRFAGFSHLDDPSNEFYDINKEDPYFINNRVRRFTANGFNEIKNFECRAPFIDNDIIDFIYSLPDKFRGLDNIYNQFLLKSFLPYFKDIPKQGIGVRLGDSSQWRLFFKKVSKKTLKKIGYNTTPFADYQKWLTKDHRIFSQILTRKNAIFPDYIQFDLDYEQSLQKKARLITAEIWFQQVFNGEFKNTEAFMRANQQ